jgi:hypothetical protein
LIVPCLKQYFDEPFCLLDAIGNIDLHMLGAVEVIKDDQNLFRHEPLPPLRVLK